MENKIINIKKHKFILSVNKIKVNSNKYNNIMGFVHNADNNWKTVYISTKYTNDSL